MHNAEATLLRIEAQMQLPISFDRTLYNSK